MSPEQLVTHVLGTDTDQSGALERTRTSDPQLRKLMLYPLSYERARAVILPWSHTGG